MKNLIKSSKTYDFIIIGGGIIGLATAYKLSLKFPEKSILVLEKEHSLAFHQTGRNSGVVHSGIYYSPKSNRGKLCRKGRQELAKFAKKYEIPFELCGKLIVATSQDEISSLEKIFENGIANHIEDIQMIDADKIKEIEPQCAGIRAIRIGCTGIIDFKRITEKFAELLQKNHLQNKVLTAQKVLSIEIKTDEILLTTQKNCFSGKKIINCGGLQAGKIADKKAQNCGVRIIGFRGDYYRLSQEIAGKFNHLIYPVPDPSLPFLGIHITKMIDGTVECGPNAIFAFKREGYGKYSFSLRDTLNALAFRGTWKMFWQYWRYGVNEYRNSFSKKRYITQARKLIPSLKSEDFIKWRCGVRAVALESDGKICDNFKIIEDDNIIHILNAPSPAATSCLAIADEICLLV